MCGIAALLAIGGGDRDLSALAPMIALVRHRGPDDEGYLFIDSSGKRRCYGGKDTPAAAYSSGSSYSPSAPLPAGAMPSLVAMGHRRLSIVDLSPSGHQPFIHENLSLTYNGEIYNFIELRRELEQKGHRFSTESDTEVLAAAWKEWGEASLQHLNGMFSFVLYDSASGKLHAVRDRFGVKPLYYWVSPAGFIAFASEIKQFTVLPGWAAVMRPQQVYDFLNWGLFDHTEETLFTGVYQLRGGQRLEIEKGASPRANGALKTVQWYRLAARAVPRPFAAAAEEYRALLSDAVKLRLRADVPIGSCLSGGLDSSTLVCLANAQLGAQGSQSVFSACSHHPRFCERRHVETVVEKTGAAAYYTYPDQKALFETLGSLVWHQDQPFGSTSIYAQWELFSLARRSGITVMLDGQGADEQLCGYHGFFGHRHYELLRSLRWRRLWRELQAVRGEHRSLPFGMLLAGKLVPSALAQPLRRLLGKQATKPLWLDMEKLGADDRFPLANCRRLASQSRQQLLESSLPMLLHYEDRDSMAHSIESRTPFLDYRLVEFTLGAPSHYKIEGIWTKRLLRESMKGLLPESIAARRDKVAFATAEEEWLRREGPALFRSRLHRAIECSQGIITPAAADHLEAMIAGKIPFSFLPWRLISFGAWVERFSMQL